jgi:hypothetical protein
MGCACGGNCACKRAEDAPIPSDPRVSPLTDGLHIPADSPALDLPRENAEIGGVDFKADSSPLPPDPRVSPLKKGLYTPSDTPTMAAEGSASSSTLIFIDLSGSTGVERADGKLIHDSLKDDIRKLIKGADSETFTIIGFGSSGGDGRLSQPYGGFTRIICESATSAEVRKCLKNDSLWRIMGGTRFPSSGMITVIMNEMFSGDRSFYPSKTIILTDAWAVDMLPASWDAESFAAEKKVWDEGTPRRGPYVFPKRKAYPIGNETHAKLALIYSTWPDNKPDAPEVRKKVFARYPELRKWFEDGKYAKKAESFAVETDDKGRYLCDFCGEKPADYNWQDLMVRWDLEDGDFTGNYEQKYHIGNENDFICEDCNESHFGAETFGADSFGRVGNSYTNYQPLPDWPSAASHGRYSIPASEREEIDEYRVGPIYQIEGNLEWCNGGSGSDGHLNPHRHGEGPLCSYCGMNMETGSFSAESFGAESDEERCERRLEIAEGILMQEDSMYEEYYDEITNEEESFGAESAFDRLEDEVADEYEEKGMSDKEAQKVGAAVAYKQGVKKYGKKIMSEAARKGVSAKSLKRAEIGPHVPTRIGATTTQRGVVKTYDSIPAGDGHVVGQFTANMDYAPSGMYGAESITDGIAKGFGSVLGIISGLIISGFAMNAVSTLTSDDEN